MVGGGWWWVVGGGGWWVVVGVGVVVVGVGVVVVVGVCGWVGGWVKFLHIERKITSVVHSHPPSHYIRKLVPG